MKSCKLLASCLMLVLVFNSAQGMESPFQSDPEYIRLAAVDIQDLVTNKKYGDINKYLYDWTMLYFKHKVDTNGWRNALDDRAKKKVELATKHTAMSPGTIANMLGLGGIKAPPATIDIAINEVGKAVDAVLQAAKGTISDGQRTKVQQIASKLNGIKK